MAGKKTRNTGLPKITQLPSGAYHATVYSHKDSSGKRHYESFTGFDYNKVLLEAAQFKADKKRGKIDTAQKGITLGKAMQEYLEAKNTVLSPSTYKGYTSIARTHFLDLQQLPINDISASQIQIAISKISARLSPKTVRNIHGFITAVFAMFRPDFSFTTTLPQKKKEEIMIPTEEEIKRLLEIVDGTPMYIPVILGACCGMRRSEICALKWEDINFKRNTITINEALVYNENNKLVEKTTKTIAGTRTIRMFPIVSDALISFKGDRAAFDPVVTISPNAITKRFERLMKKHDFPGYSLHDLRHYTVSVMLALNVPKKYIADYVGHESENMIDKVYGHIMVSKKTSVEDQMQEYFSKILG